MRAAWPLLALCFALSAAAEPVWPPETLQLVPEDERDALAAALDDAGANAPELARAVETLEAEERDAAVRLIMDMPHLDRLEMTAETLVEHVAVSFEERDGTPDSLFFPYVLNYRIDREPVEDWRAGLRERWGGEEPAEELARRINRDVAASVAERDRGFFGPVQAPLFTLSAGSGSETEIAILTTAALRAVGVPSRRVRVPALGGEEGGASWIEFHDGDDWRPLYPLEPTAFGDTGFIEREHDENVTIVEAGAGFETELVTERYTPTARLTLAFVSEGEPASDFEHFAVSVPNGGGLVPLDALQAVADGEGTFEAKLGNGTYVVAAGVRDGEGDPLVQMLEITLEPGDERYLAFDVSTNRKLGRVARPLVAWVVTDPSNEPDIRMLPLIASTLGALGAQARYVALGGDAAAEAVLDLLGREAEVLPHEDMPEDAPSGLLPEDGDETPVIELYDASTKRIILRHEGYDLNIARVIESAAGAAGPVEGKNR